MFKKIIKKHWKILTVTLLGTGAGLWAVFEILRYFFGGEGSWLSKLTLIDFILAAITVTVIRFIYYLVEHYNKQPTSTQAVQEAWLPANEVLPKMNVDFKDPNLKSIDIVGYSVHSIFDLVKPLFQYAVENNIRVRFLFLNAQSSYIYEKATLEHISNNLPLPAFIDRNTRNINETTRAIDSFAEIIKYQNNKADANYKIRVYNSLPIYRGVITNLGSAVSCYLNGLTMPGRSFLMTVPGVSTPETDTEAKRASEWFNYLWKYRSRPLRTSAVVFDLYDTLVHVDFASRAAHNKDISQILGVTVEEFKSAWETTSADSNRGIIKSTYERFIRIMDILGLSIDPILCNSLADKEHSFLRSATKVDDKAIKMLLSLKNRGYKTALLTNCSVSVLHTLSSTGLVQYFDCLVFSFEVGQMKPESSIYKLVLEKFKIGIGEAIFVGDGNNQELSGAAAAGLKPIKATWYVDRPEYECELSASSIQELTGLIDSESVWPLT